MKKILYNHSGTCIGIWTVVIFILCATPGQYIPSANWLDLLAFDKWVHASLFFILAALVIITLGKKGGQTPMILLGILACITYGGLLEVMQAKCFSNRTADWKDFSANTFGCLVALLLTRKLTRVFARV